MQADAHDDVFDDVHDDVYDDAAVSNPPHCHHPLLLASSPHPPLFDDQGRRKGKKGGLTEIVNCGRVTLQPWM